MLRANTSWNLRQGDQLRETAHLGYPQLFFWPLTQVEQLAVVAGDLKLDLGAEGERKENGVSVPLFDQPPKQLHHTCPEWRSRIRVIADVLSSDFPRTRARFCLP